MHDLAYKLCQLAKRLSDMDYGVWSNVVQAAADEIEHLKQAAEHCEPVRFAAARAEVERLRSICEEAFDHIHFAVEEHGPIKDRLISARQPGPGFPASEAGHHTPLGGGVVVGDCKNSPAIDDQEDELARRRTEIERPRKPGPATREILATLSECPSMILNDRLVTRFLAEWERSE